jgi:serine/threonine protein kinase/formylglycine-generating enzyme required for sulfatase activity
MVDQRATAAGGLLAILERFDQAWQQGPRPALANYLLPATHPEYRELVVSLVRIDIECRVKAGDEPPLVEAYLGTYAAEFSDPSDALQIIATEYEWRWRREPGVRRAEYLQRFPQYAADLPGRLKVRWDCPTANCHTTLEIADEAAETAVCPRCQQRCTLRPAATEHFDNLDKTGVEVIVPAKHPDWPNIPNYEILEQLGVGGMGVVYKARELSVLGRIVAIKMIRAGAHARPDDVTRFLTEAEAAARLEHPNIVRIYEIGKHNSQPYFSLEFVDGGSLDRKLAGKPQSATVAAQLVEVLARAMHVVHEHGIVHRDLKPSNVLLARSDRHRGLSLDQGPDEVSYFEPKIGDFGLAKRLAEGAGLTPTEAILGTPEYMSPEQAAGKARMVGPSADIYALGVILYEMLTGHPPFRGVTWMDTVQLVLTAEPVTPRRWQPKMPADLETICLKCLRKQPEKRYATAKDLADDLRRFLNGEPIVGRPVSPWEHFVTWVRRHPAAATMIALGSLLVCLMVGGLLVYDHQREVGSVHQAEALVDSLTVAETAEVPLIIDRLASYRRWADPILYRRLAETAPESKEHLHIRMALAPVSDAQIGYLYDRLLMAKPDELLTIQIALGRYKDGVKERLWGVVENRDARAGARLRAACALASYEPKDRRWPAVADDVALAALGDPSLAMGAGKDALRPVREHLSGPLVEAFVHGKAPPLPVSTASLWALGGAGPWPALAAAGSPGRIRLPEDARAAAFRLLTDYAANQPPVLVELEKNADEAQHAALLPLLRTERNSVVPLLSRELDEHLPPARTDEAVEVRDRLARQQARVAVTLIQLGDAERVWPLLRHSEDPSLRSYLTHDLARRGTALGAVVARLETESDVSARRALILALGEFAEISPTEEARLLPQLLDWYENDPDPGIHSAIDWLLRHGQKGNAARAHDWKQEYRLSEVDRKLARLSPTSLPAGRRNWFVTPGQSLTMTVIRGPQEFLIGTPIFNPNDINWNEYPHRVRIPRSFAIAAKEVTVAQFRRFLDDTPKVKQKHTYQELKSPVPEGPILEVTWFQAAQFCNWLSRQDGIPRDQWCYPDAGELDYGAVLPDDYLQRTGYRLPTEAEWEFASRAGATTSRFYGTAEDMLKEYAWFSKNSNTRTFPVGQLKPNDLGLFDIYGNAMEWCQDEGDKYPRLSADQVRTDAEVRGDDLKITRAQPRVLRGGSFFYLGRSVRSAFRDYYRPNAGIMYVGIRPARTMPAKKR